MKDDRRPSSRRARGHRAEGLAASVLADLGFTILERNVFAGGGEIDLIAEEQGVICFVEVRARKTTRFGSPEATVGRAKRGHLSAAAAAWLQRRPGPWPRCRFDVVAVLGPEGSETVRLTRNAFEVAA